MRLYGRHAYDAFAVGTHLTTLDGTAVAAAYTPATGPPPPVHDPAPQYRHHAVAPSQYWTHWGLPLMSAKGHIRCIDAVYVIRSRPPTLSDSGNPDGYLRRSAFYIVALYPTGQFRLGGMRLNYLDDSQFTFTGAGSLFVAAGPRYRKLNATLSWLSNAEVSRLAKISPAVGKAGDLLVSLYPDDASQVRSLQYTLPRAWTACRSFVSPHLNANTVTLTLQEI